MSHNYTNKIIGLICSLAFILSTNLSASQVPLAKAKEFARTAFAMKSSFKVKSAQDIKVVSEYTQKTEGQDAYYIFNMEPKGFVVVSAEDRYNPILAFSDEGQFVLEGQSSAPAFASLGKHELRIANVRAHNIKATPSIQNEWKVIKESSVERYLGKDDPEGMVVAPLTTTLWNQGEYYNSFTPRAASDDPVDVAGGTYCGCAPIAMSQLIKFHDYPAVGNGANLYEDPTYGDLSVDFCRPYNWANMPDSLTAPNDDVAEFIYHVGVSTNTRYSTTYTATFVSFVRDALVNYWNYDEAASWFFDSDGDFARIAIQDLNQGRPVMLTGDAYTNGIFGGAHAWIADGYGYFLDPSPAQPDEYFHFNWGWGGDNNGWFLDGTDSWDPIPFTFGTSTITYYENRYVVHNIFPAENNCGGLTTCYAGQITDKSAFFNTTLEENYDRKINFRYRELGTTTWIETTTSDSYYKYVSNLKPGTTYEYQVRKQCCEGEWSDYSYGAEETFTTEGDVNTSLCNLANNSNLTTSSVIETKAFVYTSKPYGEVSNQFRYRFVGSIIWTYSTIESNYYRYLTGLEPGTEYEFQVRHLCDAGEWSAFTASENFTTQGVVSACDQIFDVRLFTSSTTENNSYIYTSQPYGQVANRFRYRAAGTADWSTTNENTGYYRYLSGLTPGTEYEFQVSHQCNNQVWTDWSFSHTFVTAGGQSECDPVNGDRLYFNAVTASNAYIYTPQPYGQVANQFRYRAQGTTSWTNTNVATLYYRYLSGLASSTTYEYQVSQECQVGNWADWSTSKTFTTASGFTGGGGGEAFLLPPRESDLWDESLLEELVAKVYPNPATHVLNFEINKRFSETSTLRVVDMSGRDIEDIQLSEGNNSLAIDLSNYNPGLYLLHYNNGIESKIHKFVKQ